ncbi:hypothetical protein ACWCQG_36725, partial [Streptomyces sp. NPDC002343]
MNTPETATGDAIPVRPGPRGAPPMADGAGNEEGPGAGAGGAGARAVRAAGHRAGGPGGGAEVVERDGGSRDGVPEGSSGSGGGPFPAVAGAGPVGRPGERETVRLRGGRSEEPPGRGPGQPDRFAGHPAGAV